MLVGMSDTEHVYKTKIPLGTWVHLAFVKSGSQITFYVNGVAGGNPVDRSKEIQDSSGNLRIGMEGSTYGEWFFFGKIDEVRFYNRALSMEEMLTVMNAP